MERKLPDDWTCLLVFIHLLQFFRHLSLSLPDASICKRLSDAQKSITGGFDIAFPVITLTVINSALCVVNNE